MPGWEAGKWDNLPRKGSWDACQARAWKPKRCRPGHEYNLEGTEYLACDGSMYLAPKYLRGKAAMAWPMAVLSCLGYHRASPRGFPNESRLRWGILPCHLGPLLVLRPCGHSCQIMTDKNLSRSGRSRHSNDSECAMPSIARDPTTGTREQQGRRRNHKPSRWPRGISDLP